MDTISFKPSTMNIIRYNTLYIVIFVFAISAVEFSVFGFFLLHWSWQLIFQMIFSSIIGIGIGCTIFLWLYAKKLREYLSVAITNEQLSGPSTIGFWQKQSFSTSKLDKIKTSKQDFLGRLFGYRYLWSVDGERIYMGEKILGKVQTDECFKRLNIL